MDAPHSAATTLTFHRLSATLSCVAAAATAGYLLYRAAFPSPTCEPLPGPGLHRSNAVRRVRRSYHGPHQGSHHESHHDRRPSDASTASSNLLPSDENVDLNTVRPLADGDTVADDPTTYDDDWWNDPASMPQQRAGQNIVGLLFRVSEDNARRNAYVHRGCACNACGIVPIRGIRYRCANCADFDLCETCETQGLHIKTHIFYKVKIPAPPFGPRQMQPVWYPGDPDSCLRSLPKSAMAKLSRETGFERPELEAFWEQWTFMANTEWRDDPDDLGLAMDRKTFERCLVPSGGFRHTAPNLIYERMFSFYDTNNDDLIGFTEFLHGLSYRKRKDKLKKIFDGFDIDRDGLVSRRDFLRIFRSYFVLYKQLHRDILEGLDDQVLSSTEAHQLVSGRQPISSQFGREGRIPRADGDRQLEGKIFHSSGDVVLTDARSGVVSVDRPDTSDREAMLKRLFSRDSTHGLFSDSRPFSPAPDHPRSPVAEADPRYFRGLLSPPTAVDEIAPFLSGHLRDEDPMFVPSDDGHPDAAEPGGDDSDGYPVFRPDSTDGPGVTPTEDAVDRDEGSGGIDPGLWRPVLRETPVDGDEESRLRRQREENMRNMRRRNYTAALNRRAKVHSRRRLLERWKRRQFYLDEEEGATAPEGWNEEEDVLARGGAIDESSKNAAQPPISARSRSSSKVRFAEDTDDYEIRSNPSTSSRSVPERWGGMEIPDAERDGGKEILYQVAQQAFNELLDILFKTKEDLAVEAAETRSLREAHRPLFDSLDLDKEEILDESLAPRDFVDGVKPTDDRTLDQLLVASGYTVDESFLQQAPQEADDDFANAIDGAAGEGFARRKAEIPAPPPAEGEGICQPSPPSPERRDPTMPQFMPNSSADIQCLPAPGSVPRQAGAVPAGHLPSLDKEKAAEASPAGPGTEKGERRASMEMPEPIPRATLVRWKRLDMAEKEARDRGGWGTLTYGEFEDIYKAEESQANRLDYLGSWIDFCIP